MIPPLAIARASATVTSVVPTGPSATPITLDLQLLLQAVVLAAILGAAKYISRELKEMKTSVNTLSTGFARIEQWAEDHQKADDQHVVDNRAEFGNVHTSVAAVAGNVPKLVRDEVRVQRGGT